MRDFVQGIQIVYKLVIIRKKRKYQISKEYFLSFHLLLCNSQQSWSQWFFPPTSTDHSNSKVVQRQKVKRGFKTSVNLIWSHRRAAEKHALSFGWETLRSLQFPNTCHSHSIIEKELVTTSSSSSYSPNHFSSITTSLAACSTEESRACCTWSLIGSRTRLCRHNTGARRTLAGPSQTGPFTRKWGKQDMRSLEDTACVRACARALVAKSPQIRTNPIPTTATSKTSSSSSGAGGIGWTAWGLLSLTKAPPSGWLS